MSDSDLYDMTPEERDRVERNAWRAAKAKAASNGAPEHAEPLDEVWAGEGDGTLWAQLKGLEREERETLKAAAPTVEEEPLVDTSKKARKPRATKAKAVPEHEAPEESVFANPDLSHIDIANLPYDEAKDILAELGCGAGEYYGDQIRCPTEDHIDNVPSAYLKDDDDGGFIVGCSVCGSGSEYFAHVAGFIRAGKPKPESEYRWSKKSRSYVNRHGKTISHEVDVHDYSHGKGKDRVILRKRKFRFVGEDGILTKKKTFVWEPYGAHHPLYKQDEVDAAENIILTEGEPDADRLNAHGLPEGWFATTLPDGSSTRLDDRLLVPLVTKLRKIITDNDDPGKAWPPKVLEHLERLGHRKPVATYICTKGKDVSEHLSNGGTLEVEPDGLVDITEELEEAEAGKSAKAEKPTKHEKAVAERLEWLKADHEAKELLAQEQSGIPPEEALASLRPIDLSTVSGVPAKPDLLQRTDGVPCLYRGKNHVIYGESESAKTWILLSAGTEALDGGGLFAFLDFEDDENTFKSRMKVLGVTDAVLDDLDRVRYIRPDVRIIGNEAAEQLIWDAIQDADIVGIDGSSDGMVLHGLNPFGGNDNSAVVLNAFLKRASQQAPNSAVVSIDHVGKSGSSQIGSQHKRAGITGVQILTGPVQDPFAPGLYGAVEVWIRKDRPGGVRAECDPKRREDGAQRFGTYYLNSTVTPSMWHIEPWDTSKAYASSVDAAAMEAVAKWFDEQDLAGFTELSRNEVEKQTIFFGNGNVVPRAAKTTALDRLIAEGRVVEKRGPRNARLNSLKRSFTATFGGAK